MNTLNTFLRWLASLWRTASLVLSNEAGVVILGNETTGNIEQSQRVVDMSEAILLLEPEEAPFTVLLRKLSKDAAINPEFSWLEDEAAPFVDQVNNGAGYTAGDTSVVVDNGGYFAAKDLVKVFRTGEVLSVTSVSVNTLTVARSWGATAAAALVDNDFLYILGSAHPEGDTVGAARMTKKVKKSNYLEIFRTPIKITKTAEASKLYGGSERTFQRRKKGMEHNRSLERAFWFGEKNEDLSADPRRSTSGVFEFVTTNKTTLTDETEFTQAEFDKFLETVFMYGSDERWVFCSPRMLRLINSFASNAIRIMQLEVGKMKDQSFGIQISRYQSAHGTVNLLNSRVFKDYRTVTNVAGKVLVAVDIEPEGAAYRYLNSRDTQLKTEIQPNDADYWLDEYISECGLKLGQERRHGILAIDGP